MFKQSATPPRIWNKVPMIHCIDLHMPNWVSDVSRYPCSLYMYMQNYLQTIIINCNIINLNIWSPGGIPEDFDRWQSRGFWLEYLEAILSHTILTVKCTWNRSICLRKGIWILFREISYSDINGMGGDSGSQRVLCQNSPGMFAGREAGTSQWQVHNSLFKQYVTVLSIQ